MKSKTTVLPLLLSALAVSCGFVPAATTYTNHVLVRFDGGVSGTTYTLGAGEIDTTGSFKANGTPTLAGGLATLDGGTSHDGFDFNPTGLGSLTTQNWVAEVYASFATFETVFRTLMDVQGDLDLRINNGATALQLVYWDGANEHSVNTALPTLGEMNHFAIVWDAVATSATAYINGVSIGTANGNAFATPDSSNVSFGYFGRSGFDNRGINGTLDAVAFSTFTGSFDPSSDLILAVPEPGTALLGSLGLLAMFRRRR